jgi:hypothetical protein
MAKYTERKSNLKRAVNSAKKAVEKGAKPKYQLARTITLTKKPKYQLARTIKRTK